LSVVDKMYSLDLGWNWRLLSRIGHKLLSMALSTIIPYPFMLMRRERNGSMKFFNWRIFFQNCLQKSKFPWNWHKKRFSLALGELNWLGNGHQLGCKYKNRIRIDCALYQRQKKIRKNIKVTREN
jgi:hypothetical protein